MSYKNLRCKEEGFFNLMQQPNQNDNSHTMKEQIATENNVKYSYKEFLKKQINDPE